MSATNASTDVGQKSAEQVLMTLRDFLKDDQVTVSEATKQLIGSDIPVTPMNENISVGSVNLWKADIALWYLAAERRSLKPGAFEDGIVEKLYIAVDTKKICLSRDSADEIIKVKPQIQIPEFHVIRDLQFSKEQLTNPGWRVEYEFKGKKVYLAFRFKTCATLIDISSK